MMNLTPMQSKIVRLIGEGKNRKQVALALGISKHTVIRHIHMMYDRVGDRNMAVIVYKYERETK